MAASRVGWHKSRVPRIAIACSLLLALGVGCNAPLSESGRLRLEPHLKTLALTSETLLGWSGDAPLLEGALVCPRFSCARDCPAEVNEPFPNVSACYTYEGTGAFAPEGTEGCLRVTGAGALGLELTPREVCGVDVEVPFAPDRFTLSGVSFASVRARPWLGVERILLAPEAAALTLPLVEPPADLLAAEDDYRVLAGAPVRLPVEVVRLDDAPVAIDDDSFLRLDPAPVELLEEGLSPLVVLDDGGAYVLTAEVHGRALDAGAVRAVAADRLASLELLPFLLGSGDAATRKAGPPGAPRALDLNVSDTLEHLLAVRAVVRDDEGNLVHGVPVEWDLEAGAAVVNSMNALTERHAERFLDEGGAGDLVTLSDLCRPPEALEGELRWTLVARFGALEARREIELEIGAPLEAPDARAPWSPSENCRGPDVAPARGGQLDEPPLQINPVAPSCGCAETSPGPLWLGLLALAALRRRRAR